MTVHAVARHLIVLDRSTGLYHRAQCVGRVPIFFVDAGCEVQQHNLTEVTWPEDPSKRVLHQCMFWREET